MIPIRLIRRRIRSIKSTAKITKAMEMIAASKMRQAQLRVLAARPYAEKMRGVLANLSAQPKGQDEIHPLLQHREVKRIAVIHITSDRGLCGGLNANVNRKTASFVLEQKVPVAITAVGRKGRDYMARYGREIRAVFTQIGDQPTLLDTTSISRVVMDDYTKGEIDEVYLSYTQFVSTVNQRPVLWKLLPIEPASIERTENVEYIYEPAPAIVLEKLLPRYLEMQVYHAILESIASEQSARMVSMRNATENANEMIDELTLVYNKARQELITNELLDIAGGILTLS
ncbi:MAG: ATP synthase F1 subunit gamma [Chloroflexi bacterium RBG_13_52_14]|nr:MAG: ATP synthase F1 subunit gamma [Chloroflexi bacterium RBG_13_52_14]